MKMTHKIILPRLVNILKDSQWFRDYLSIVDFVLYELVFYFNGYCPSILDPIFEEYMQRFEAL